MIDPEQKLFECWTAGVSLGETVRALKRLGVVVSKETVRQAFIRFGGARP